MLTFRKYEKHVRTLIDQIVFDYFYLMKSLNLSDCDFTEFSSSVYTLHSESIDNIDFIIKIKKTLKILDLNNNQKEKILLKKLDELFEYEKFARKELYK